MSVLKTKTVSVFSMVMILMPVTDERSFSIDNFLSVHQEQEATITAAKIRKYLCDSQFKKWQRMCRIHVCGVVGQAV